MSHPAIYVLEAKDAGKVTEPFKPTLAACRAARVLKRLLRQPKLSCS